jgi:hypothetical protein
MDALQKTEDGRLTLETPPDPRTGDTLLALDPPEWIHRIRSHISYRGRYGQRFYGTYSKRTRVSCREENQAGSDLVWMSGSPSDAGLAPESADKQGSFLARTIRVVFDFTMQNLGTRIGIRRRANYGVGFTDAEQL